MAAAEHVLRLVKIAESADEQIEAPVVVVIEPHGAGAPSRSAHAGLGRHVGEGAVAVVVIENAVWILSDIQIGESVAVVVSHGHAHSVSIALDASFGGDVSERAVAIISIERVVQRSGGRVEVAGAAVYQINI